MKQRLRGNPDEDELGAMYGRLTDRSEAPGQRERIALSVGVGIALIDAFPPAHRTGADLSAAEGAILRRIGEATRLERLIFGDLAPGWDIAGPLPETLAQLPDVGVGLYVCCETLEHVPSPRILLKEIREHASLLLVSTPVDAWGDANREHIWAWDRAEVEGMLGRSRWQPQFYAEYGNYYRFGIWGCV